MRDFNKVYLIGNLTKDPEAVNVNSTNKLVNFSIAVNRTWKGSEGEENNEVSYMDCVTYGKKAEIVEKYLFKGRRVFVTGRLQQSRWEDKDTKKQRSKIRVVVEDFHFMDGKKAESVPAIAGNEEASSCVNDFDGLD